jgi:diguanylate cyclase (GGDEF)-like protein
MLSISRSAFAKKFNYIPMLRGWVQYKQILILASFVMLAIVLLMSFASFLENQTKTWMHQLEIKKLSAQADIVAHSLALIDVAENPRELNSFVAKLRRNQDFRITVLNKAGVVLADSWLTLDEVAVTDNYAERPEVVQSSLHNAGIQTRYSNTVGKELMYVSKRYDNSHFSGYIRVATQPSIMAADLAILHRELMQTIFVIFVVLLGIAIYIYRHIKQNKLLAEAQNQTLACLDTQSKTIALTQKFGQALTTCESREELIQVISKMGSHLFGENTFGALAVSPPSLDAIEVIASWGDWSGDERFHPKECWGFRRGVSHMSKSNSMDIKCNHLEVKNDYAVQCIPLQSQGISLGSLHIGAHEDIFESTTFKNKINAVSEQLCLTIANLNLRRKLEQQAIRDPLTTLYNRRYLDESFPRELKRAERKGSSLAVIMIDIDHFKVFNDTYGHDAGDYVIQKFAKLLLDAVRGEDISCRYGGEEFALLLNEIDLNVVKTRAEALLQATRDLVLQHNSQSLGQITISLGIAMFPLHGKTQQELIKAADQALYEAKNAGRNQLKVAEVNVLPSKQVA